MDWYHILILICIGAFGLWISIPYGLAFGFDPWIICATNIIGSTIGVVAVYYLGKFIKRFLNRKESKKLISRSRVKMLRIMDKRGLVGNKGRVPFCSRPLISHLQLYCSN